MDTEDKLLRVKSSAELLANLSFYCQLADEGKLYYCNHDVPVSLPDCLSTPEAIELWTRLQRAGWVDANYCPIGLSLSKKAVLAMELGKRLGVFKVWKYFGEFWNVNADTLRSAYNKALYQKNTFNMIDEIQALLKSEKDPHPTSPF